MARAGNHDADRLDVAAGRNRVDHVARHHRARRDVLHVDDRRFGGDGDRFLERADLHVGVDGGGEVRRQLEPSRLTMLNPGSVNVTV